MQGGDDLGNLTLTRYYALHVFILPFLFTLLTALHVYLRRKHGPAAPASLSDEQLRAKAQPFWPHQLFLAVLAMAVCAAVLLGMTISTHGSELYAPADPGGNFAARPEWYFVALYQLLKFFEGPMQVIGTVLIPGAVATFLVALPFIDRGKDRRIGSRKPVLVMVAGLMSATLALSAMAVIDDGNNEELQKALEEAAKASEKARALAKEGVAPEGGTAVWRNDPEYQVRALYKEHCGNCHTLDGVGGDEAPSFDGYGTREWLATLIRNPADPQIYGGTKHDTMEPTSAEDLPDDQLAAIVEFTYGLMGESAVDVDRALFTRGKELFDGDLECSNCHEIEGESSGPAFKGRGSVAWLERVIADSSAPDLFIDTAEMPKFEGKLTPEEIEQLAILIDRQRVLAEGQPKADGAGGEADGEADEEADEEADKEEEE